MDSYQNFIFTRTYARYRDDLGRRETWQEVVDRYMDFMLENLGDKLKKEEYEEVKEAILNQDVVPSMRLMWGAGEPVRKNNSISYNCSFIIPTKWQDFGEILFLLTCGCGVGFSVESKFVNQLQTIGVQKGKKFKLVVPDNREGWANALSFGLSKWANGEDVEFDYSKIRPKGSRLKTMGGRASGHEPLKNLLEFTREKLLSRQGYKLRPIDVHDIICKVGDIVIAGGVRRSSEISLSDLTDEEMRDAKKGAFYNLEPQRSMANNSAVYEEKPPIAVFMKEWLALMESGSGERGIFNRGGLKDQMPKRRFELSEAYLHEMGTNPSLRAGTRVLTKEGVFKIEQLDGQEFLTKNLNGEWSKAKCFLSSNNAELYKIDFGAGRTHYATKEHKWPVITKSGITKKTTIELVIGDKIPKIKSSVELGSGKTRQEGFSIGWLYGDGWITERKNSQREYGFLFSNKEKELSEPILEFVNSIKENKSNLNNQNDGTFAFQISDNSFDSKMRRKYGVDKKELGIPDSVFNSGLDYAVGFIDGLFSSDGCVSAGTVTLVSSRLKLLEDMSQLLSVIGINSDIRKRKPRKGIFPNGKNYERLYYSYVLRISQGSIGDFRNLVGLSHKEKNTKLSLLNGGKSFRNYETIRSIENTKIKEPVWDITVMDETHCFYIPWVITGNCGEITLRSKQFCNLSEVVARKGDTQVTLLEKIKVATIIGTYQSMLTNFPFLSKEWKENCDQERLLGVSITGQFDSKKVRNPATLETMKDYAIKINKQYSKKFGINSSSSVTCVKPSGTVSQLVNSSSGMHPRYSPFYIRRVRISATDPLFKMLKDQGVPHKPEVGQVEPTVNTFVLEFPVKSPEGAITSNELSALDQLEHWKMVKENYTEHNPSQTVHIKDDEWLEVGNWIYKNWNIIGGLSFLPKTSHVYELAPYEEITETQYNKLVKSMPDIDFSRLSEYEKEDNTIGSKETACMAGTCELM